MRDRTFQKVIKDDILYVWEETNEDDAAELCDMLDEEMARMKIEPDEEEEEEEDEGEEAWMMDGTG